jgi:Tfp pilus assembly protein FimT
MRKSEAGFSVIEVTVVAGVAMIAMGLAAPSIINAIDSYKFSSEVQNVASTIRSARYKAVSSNVTLRLRFNCPETGQMRLVEVTGDSAIDSASDRCDTDSYPYPDPDASAAPNNDGPVIQMSSAIDLPSTVHGLQISTSGRIQPLAGCPGCTAGSPPAVLMIGDDRSSTSRNITVTATGGTTIARNATARTEDR